jgi:cell division protein FtsB
LTGRAAVLALVVAALMVSYASSLRAYLEQRSHIASLRESITESEAAIAGLEREKRRWDDPAYVVQQARARFAYGFPGEIGYQVLDVDGRPLHHQDSLPDPAELEEMEPVWWQETLASIEAAGRRPEATAPATRLTVDSTRSER